MFLFSNFKVTASFEVIACSASIAMLRSLAADSRYLVCLGGDSTTLFQPKNRVSRAISHSCYYCKFWERSWCEDVRSLPRNSKILWWPVSLLLNFSPWYFPPWENEKIVSWSLNKSSTMCVCVMTCVMMALPSAQKWSLQASSQFFWCSSPWIEVRSGISRRWCGTSKGGVESLVFQEWFLAQLMDWRCWQLQLSCKCGWWWKNCSEHAGDDKFRHAEMKQWLHINDRPLIQIVEPPRMDCPMLHAILPVVSQVMLVFVRVAPTYHG